MADKVRVLLVVRWPVGGIRTFIKYVYCRFPSDLYSFTIVTPDLPEVDALVADMKESDVSFVRLRKPSCWAIARETFSQLATGSYDIVHSHGFTSGTCAALPALLLQKPHIMTSHDVLNAAQFTGARGAIRKCALMFLLRAARFVHSVSCDAQGNLESAFPFLNGRDKSVVIRNGIDTTMVVRAGAADLRKELGLDPDVLLLGFFGRFMAQKGFKCLVDAVEQVKRQPLSKPLRVACFGSGGFVREERQKLEARGLAEDFVFLPFIPNIASTIKALDAVVVPSLWEACPLLPMEVLVAGVPLISSSCIGLREVVRGTPAITFTPGSSSELAEKIDLLTRSDCAPAFRSFVDTAVHLFDVEAQVTLMRALYDRSILEARSSS